MTKTEVQELRNIIDAIVTECSENIQLIHENEEYFTDDRDYSLSESFLGIKNLLLKYVESHEKIFW